MRTERAALGWRRERDSGDGNPVPPKLVSRCQSSDLEGLAEGDGGELLIATHGGIRRLVDGKARAVSRCRGRRVRTPTGSSAIAMAVCGSERTGSGLLHVHQGRTDVFSRAGRSLGRRRRARLSRIAKAISGSATTDGLDRFREFAVPTMSAEARFVERIGVRPCWRRGMEASGLAGPKGLDRWKRWANVTIYRKRDGLPDDAVSLPCCRTMAGESGCPRVAGLPTFENGRFIAVDRQCRVRAVLDGRQQRGISGSRQVAESFAPGGRNVVVEEIPWPQLGRKDYAIAMLRGSLTQGGLWLGFRRGGVAYFKDGQVRASYDARGWVGRGHGLRSFNSIGTVRSGPQPRAG